MPTDTAMAILNAYRIKRKQNPATDRATLFKYVLWDRFDGTMVSDDDIADMVADSPTLAELSLHVLKRENPAMADPMLEKSAKSAIWQYFVMNYPDGV